MRRDALRTAAGVLVLVLWAAFAEARFTRGQVWAIHDLLQGTLTDSFAVNQSRFEVLRDDLPQDSAVGYISDLPRNDRLSSFTTGRVEAQYALAPHLVFDTDTLREIVGDFHGPPPDSSALATRGLRVVRDYGRGVLLLGRSAR